MLGCVLALALLMLWTAVQLVLARGDLVAARDTLEGLRDDGQDAQEVSDALGGAEEQLRRAAERLAAPGARLAGALPLIGRTPDAVRRTTDGVLAGVVATRSVLAVARERPLLDDGALDLERLDAVGSASEAAADRLAPAVRDLEEVELGLVPGAVAEPVRTARAELADLTAGFAQADRTAWALRGFLGGEEPRRLLVVLQNNAELRGTGGLVSVFAEATARDGRLELGAFRDVEDVADPAGAVREVAAPEDYRAVFGPLRADTTLWKNTNADPDVPRSSRVLAEVAGATLGARPDGVVWLDVPAMGAVLSGTTPALLPDGTELTGDNAVEVLLSDSYERVTDDDRAQAERRARLRAASDAVAGRLLRGSPDITRLAAELASAARGRHVALWSSREDEQAAFEAAGTAGAVAAEDGDLLAFTVHNLGAGDRSGNKLDLYARRSLEQVVRVERDVAEVERTVTLRNTAPSAGLPGYVAGRVAPGTTNNLVLHSLPARAEVLSFSRGDQQLAVAVQRLGDTAVLTDTATLPPGAEISWAVRYRLPLETGSYALRVLPQPLAVDGELRVTIVPGEGLRLTTPRAGSSDPLQGDVDELRWGGSLTDRLDLRARAVRPGLLSRFADGLARFWSEPVEIPW